MSPVQSIQFFVALNLFIMGLSHFLQPGIWIQFFQFLYQKGHVGNIFNAMLSVGMGSIILAFHWLWNWPLVLVTLYGLALLLKGFIFLIFPSIGLRSIGSVNEKAWKFKWVGLMMCILSLMLAYPLISTGVLG
ncbi:hypothetical protein WIW50_09445 [Flavobacteriaceae bacterium 3-367]|uniref:hypothetical protein n=1 Tax=Eudoraea algarum TaxID=3417568 RepID=UPI00327DF613